MANTNSETQGVLPLVAFSEAPLDDARVDEFAVEVVAAFSFAQLKLLQAFRQQVPEKTPSDIPI